MRKSNGPGLLKALVVMGALKKHQVLVQPSVIVYPLAGTGLYNVEVSTWEGKATVTSYVSVPATIVEADDPEAAATAHCKAGLHVLRKRLASVEQEAIEITTEIERIEKL